MTTSRKIWVEYRDLLAGEVKDILCAVGQTAIAEMTNCEEEPTIVKTIFNQVIYPFSEIELLKWIDNW